MFENAIGGQHMKNMFISVMEASERARNILKINTESIAQGSLNTILKYVLRLRFVWNN